MIPVHPEALQVEHEERAERFFIGAAWVLAITAGGLFVIWLAVKLARAFA